MNRRGCGCCGCREFDKRWCGIADAAEATAAGVTLVDGEYTINFNLPIYDWAVLVTFPEIREREDYYYGGYCGTGAEWGSGEFRHTIRVRNQSDVVLLELRVTITKDVPGVDDHVFVEVLETTANFDAVLLRNYSLVSDKNGGRYIPSMRIIRREGITSVEFQGLQLLVDAVPEGESFDSLTRSTALYARTESLPGDTHLLISFKSGWVSGDYADPTGDWIVTGFEVANVGDSLNLDCPDPRICAVNSSTYSSPQWEADALSVSLDPLYVSTEDWSRNWTGCVGTYLQPSFIPWHNSSLLQGGQIDQSFGYYWATFDDVFNVEARITRYPDGNLQAIAPFSNAWTPFLTGGDSFGELYFSPLFQSTLLSSTTPGKRKVRLDVQVPLTFNKPDLSYQYHRVQFSPELPGGGWPFSNPGWDPSLVTQLGVNYGFANSYIYVAYQIAKVYRENPDAPGTYEFVTFVNNLNPAQGTTSRVPAPSGLTESVFYPNASAPYGLYWSPMYLLHSLPRPGTDDRVFARYEKDVDEWDGEPPTITFGLTDVIYIQSAAYGFGERQFTVPVSMVHTYNGYQLVTVKYSATGGPKTYTYPVYKFSTSLTTKVVDFELLDWTIKPTTGPMPQPANL